MAPLLAFLQLRWLKRDRMVAYSRILAFASLASLVWFFFEAMGALGSDFLAFWSAGRLAIEGKAAAAYDPALLHAVQASVGRHDVFAFVNPPPLLLVVWPLGLLDYPSAWIAWIAATYALWLLATHRLFRRVSWPIAAYPGAWLAAIHAQTGFLTSAIQAAVAGCLRDRPFTAGLFVGALIVKPHLAVLFPVAFLAAREWRAITGAAVSVAGLLLLSWLVFGTDTMLAYPQAWSVTEHLIATGSDDFFLRQTSVYAMIRVAFSPQAALMAQAIVTLAMVVLVWVAWTRSGAVEGKLALLFAATPLATPYLFAYDLPFLVMSFCWLVEHEREKGFPAWSRPLLLLLYLSPMLARAMALPIGINPMPIVSLATVWMIWRRLHQSFRPEPAA